MDAESQHIKYLIIVAAMLCAVIIGYNAFYVPDADMSAVNISTDTSSLSVSGGNSDEEYTPNTPSSENAGYVFSSAESKLSSNSSYVDELSGVKDKKTGSSGKASSTMRGKVNINTASASELSSGLDGIGDVIAKRIVEYREKNGNFKTIEDIKKVSGIGDKKFENIKNHITV